MSASPHFTAELTFHFREHGPERRRSFMFGEDLVRNIPMQMDGVEGLNTIQMRAPVPGQQVVGDSLHVDCRVIAPDLFADVIKPGATFHLWDGGFFATGVILERVNEGWSGAS